MIINMYIDSYPRVHLPKPELIKSLNNDKSLALQKSFHQRHSIHDETSEIMIIYEKIPKTKEDPSGDQKPSPRTSSIVNYTNDYMTLDVNEEELALFELKTKLIRYFNKL